MAKQKNVYSKNPCFINFPKGNYFFVYGTLKSNFKNEFANTLFKQCIFLGQSYSIGNMFLVNWYPGALFDSNIKSIVVGELYFKKEHVFPLKNMLDKYEGIGLSFSKDEYISKEIKVNNKNKIYKASTYQFNFKIPFSSKNNFKKRYIF